MSHLHERLLRERREAGQTIPNEGNAMKPGITLTGADEKTPLADMVRLADAGAEIGLLYTFSPDGRNRYPRIEWIRDAAAALVGRCALHVCGGRARAQLAADGRFIMASKFSRIQINGKLSMEEAEAFCRQYACHKIITQHTASELVAANAPNHAILVDGSGGRGLSPPAWVRPPTAKHVGFAGGLGPHNLAGELPKIEAASDGSPFWIDMEGRLRDSSDWFSIERANAVMRIWSEWKRSQEAAK